MARRSEENGQMEGYKLPREDINAPDMYIPGKLLQYHHQIMNGIDY